MTRRSLAIAVIALISGCADMGAIHDISTRLNFASSSWKDVAKDFIGSCQREQQTNPALTDCKTQEQATQGLLSVDTLLSHYFKAISDAAADRNFSIASGLKEATTSVSNIPGIDQRQTKAVSGLIEILANSVLESTREDTVRKLLDQGIPHASVLIDGLDKLVIPNLSTQLSTEKNQLSGRFAHMILAQKDSFSPDTVCQNGGYATFSPTSFLLAIEYCSRLSVIDERIKALNDYKSSLESAQKALEELQFNKTKLTGKLLSEHLYTIGSDLNDKVEAVKKAFS